MMLRHNKSFFWGVFIALFLTIVILNGFPPFFVKKAVLLVSQPLFFLKSKISESSEDENILLKQRVIELELEKKFCDVVLEENKELKSVFYANSEKSFILASIILRPGQGVYNSLIIDAGSDQGVWEGMQVTAFGNVLLGYVFDVMSDFSRVKLISHPQKESNVFISNLVPGIAVGLGGENLEVELPSDVEIKVGDKITTLGTDVLFVGIVEKIIKQPADPFQKIIFRLPVNIQELRYVYLIK